MKWLDAIAGGIAGVLLAAGLPELAARWREPEPARLISDAHGALAVIDIQYRQDFNPAVIETLADLFAALPGDVDIRVVVSQASEFAFLKEELRTRGVDRLDRLRPVVTGFPITPWARDRFGALEAGGRPVLAVPPFQSSLPGPRGQDDRVPALLASGLAGAACRSLPFQFEGGDLLADESHAFLLANALARNGAEYRDNGPALRTRIEAALGKRLVVIGERPEDVPDHHICMVVTPLGKRRVAVADPWLGLEIWRNNPAGEPVDVETDPSAYEPFRTVRLALERQGFQVMPIPLLLTRTPRVYVSYNNALLEQREGMNRLYMPVYGIPALDRAAAEAFESAGWRVRPVRVARLFRHTGSLRCQVGVIRRTIRN